MVHYETTRHGHVHPLDLPRVPVVDLHPTVLRNLLELVLEQFPAQGTAERLLDLDDVGSVVQEEQRCRSRTRRRSRDWRAGGRVG